MPTGYTADVKDGKVTKFKDFALICARAMGAAIMQREDPMGPVKIPDIEEDNYYSKRIKELEADMLRYRDMNDDEWNEMMKEENMRRLESHRQQVIESRLTRNRYRDMMDKVEDWTPPTTEHQNFKDFMIQQLEESIKFDCITLSAPVLETDFGRYKQIVMRQALKDMDFYHEKSKEDRKRQEDRRKWIIDLVNSLEKIND